LHVYEGPGKVESSNRVFAPIASYPAVPNDAAHKGPAGVPARPRRPREAGRASRGLEGPESEFGRYDNAPPVIVPTG